MIRLLIVFSVIFLTLQACQHQNNTYFNTSNTQQAAVFNVQLGLAYLKQGDRARARRKLLTALEQAPNSPVVNSAMAYFMEQSSEISRARVYYQKAIAVAPGQGAQLNNYGAFLCRQGDYAKAQTYFLKAVNDLHYENIAAAYENAGLCAVASKDNARAMPYFIEALKHDPMRTQALYELVNIEEQQGMYKNALNHLQQHNKLLLSDKSLLALAVFAANKTGQMKLAADYSLRLQIQNNGVKHAHITKNR